MTALQTIGVIALQTQILRFASGTIPHGWWPQDERRNDARNSERRNAPIAFPAKA
jgi:ribonuclease I